MKMGQSFEDLSHQIFELLKNDNSYESVLKNIYLDGKDGKRQIDVLLKGKVGPIDIITIIECKDHNKNIDVTYIDALHSKMQDVNANKAILVARKGFTNNARHKAQRLGITLCTAHSVNSEKWKFQLEIPIIIKEVSSLECTPSFIFTAIDNQNELVLSINDIPIEKIIATYWNSKDFWPADSESEHVCNPLENQILWSRLSDGRKILVSDFQLRFKINIDYYFGYLNDVESAKYLNFVTENKTVFTFNPSDLSNYREIMAKYKEWHYIPKVDKHIAINIKISHPEDPKVKLGENVPNFIKTA